MEDQTNGTHQPDVEMKEEGVEVSLRRHDD